MFPSPVLLVYQFNLSGWISKSPRTSGVPSSGVSVWFAKFNSTIYSLVCIKELSEHIKVNQVLIAAEESICPNVLFVQLSDCISVNTVLSSASKAANRAWRRWTLSALSGLSDVGFLCHYYMECGFLKTFLCWFFPFCCVFTATLVSGANVL